MKARLPKGMGGGPQNMQGMLRQAQKMQEDIETLSDILVAAVNEAIKKVNETNNAEMSKVTGSLNIPGLPGMF